MVIQSHYVLRNTLKSSLHAQICDITHDFFIVRPVPSIVFPCIFPCISSCIFFKYAKKIPLGFFFKNTRLQKKYCDLDRSRSGPIKIAVFFFGALYFFLSRIKQQTTHNNIYINTMQHVSTSMITIIVKHINTCINTHCIDIGTLVVVLGLGLGFP